MPCMQTAAPVLRGTGPVIIIGSSGNSTMQYPN